MGFIASSFYDKIWYVAMWSIIFLPNSLKYKTKIKNIENIVHFM